MSDFWTNPKIGKRYPTHFELTFSGLVAHIVVDVPYKPQEILSARSGMSKYEGLMIVTGTLRGQSVTGEGYVEMVGRW